ncbi:preprotein translocase subunit YajC [Ruania suaedae]|uniref:preprotein translocase subunit YajC n=1 Tax=Ruania suaedae TaxID=2897774 RepID=UPI001E51F279|nr:preprotein translocase subunit YajC [Ruania suaedae]UFU01574.1 preprotein translocase subunit YajC [Ruania suaedae]
MDPTFLIILVVGLGALLFLNWRSRKQQQQRLSFRDDLQVGQEVQTIGGLIGTVVHVEGDVVTLESAPGTHVRFVKAALAKLIEPEVTDETEATDEQDGEETAEVGESEHAAGVEADHSEDPTRPEGFETRDELKDIRRDDRI